MLLICRALHALYYYVTPHLLQETQEMRFLSLGQEGPLEEEMAAHSSILAWRILRMEEPGELQSMGSNRGGHDTEQLTVSPSQFRAEAP